MTQEIRLLARHLRQLVPPILPVRVYVRENLVEWGTASLKRANGRAAHFVVEIRRTHAQTMKDTLLHEWAHCLAWREGDLVEDHGPEWGLAMSAVYTAAVGP